MHALRLSRSHASAVILPCLIATPICLWAGMLAPRANATEFSVDSAQVGAFYGPFLPSDFPDPMPDPPISDPDNAVAFQNYFLGRTSTLDFTTSERRVFFIYDLSGIAPPAGEVVTGVSIDLVLLAGGTSALANFTDDFELVEFTSTPFSPVDLLDTGLTGADDLSFDIWDSLGTGELYGEFDLLSPAFDSPTMPGTHTIDLPGAILDVDDALGSSFIVISARLVTYDPGPVGTPGFGVMDGDTYEYVFGVTDIHSGVVPPPPLTITTALVPEPSSLAMLSLGVIAFLRRRRA